MHVRVRAAVTGERSGRDLAEVYAQFGLTVATDLPVSPGPEQPMLDAALYSAERIVGRPRHVQPRSRGPIAL
jgi:hypothetical protein